MIASGATPLGQRTPTPTAPAAGVLGDLEGEGLCVTHWFDSGEVGEPYTATVRFTGHHVQSGRGGRNGTFVKEESVPAVMPGSGQVSVSTWVSGLEPGEWNVTAELRRSSAGRLPATVSARQAGHTLPRASWSWSRRRVVDAPFEPVHTRWAPMTRFVSIPAVVHGSWLGLISAGVFLGAVVQTAILATFGIGLGIALIVDALALAAGIAGGKVWFAASQTGPWRRAMVEGMSVDGFLVAALVVGVGTMLALNVPIGTFLDGSTPGLFFGVAVGRIGCFLTGCCAGRCTRSRWGVWSSDRRIGARRIPTQLMESATGLVIGLSAFAALLWAGYGFGGAVFISALAAYVLVRQFLLRLRAVPHDLARARIIGAVAAAVLVADVVAALVLT